MFSVIISYCVVRLQKNMSNTKKNDTFFINKWYNYYLYYLKRKCVKIRKIFTVKMEVYAEEKDKPDNLHSEEKQIHRKEKMMEKRNLNLKEATNYLIQLFYETNQKYSCTRTKLGKILSILAFKYALNGVQIFNENIFRYPPCCGTLIKELMFIVPRDIYIRDVSGTNYDCLCEITEEINCCLPVPEQYKESTVLPVDIKEEIERVFRHFGAYPASELGKLLNPIVEQVVIEPSDKIELDKFKSVSLDIDNNAVIKYLCNR